MTPGFVKVLQASDKDRRDLFVGCGTRMGTVEQNVEKDFWVCWTLDALFNEVQGDGPRLLFKGGTSLSKGYGLIARFSEDIDITVFREDIGQAATVEELNALSGKKRSARLDAIRTACQEFVNGRMRERFAAVLGEALEIAKIDPARARVEQDPDDPDQQSLLLWYPTVAADGAAYIRRAVKIESGAKSALDPHAQRTVTPYVAEDLPDQDFTIKNITTVEPGRSFWDKVVILHGLRRWWDRRGELKGGGQRVSRHYYDVHKLLRSEHGDNFLTDTRMGEDCVQHARMFFNRADFDLASAVRGSFALAPHDGMLTSLERDYEAMAGMVFGDIPTFGAIMESIADVERQINAAANPERAK